jgi:hypothetical protein
MRSKRPGLPSTRASRPGRSWQAQPKHGARGYRAPCLDEAHLGHCLPDPKVQLVKQLAEALRVIGTSWLPGRRIAS